MIPPEAQAQRQGKKQGANTTEANQMRHLFAEGHPVQFVSDALMIQEACVQSYADDFEANREKYERLWAGAGYQLRSQSTSHNQPGGEEMTEYFEDKVKKQRKQKTLLD